MQRLPPLHVFESRYEEYAALAGAVRARAGNRPLRVLEAGCGRRWELDLDGVDFELTGIDVDREALRIRQEEVGDLDRVVTGDLRDAEIDDAAFDVVYNSFVLEHIDGAERVLENLCRWLRPGGLLILRLPDRQSVYGFMARSTPLWVHTWFRRTTQRDRQAGRAGHGPYPTFYDPVVSRAGIHRFCAEHGLEIRAEYGAAYYLKRGPAASIALRVATRLLGFMSLGTLATGHNNLTYVIEKPAASGANHAAVGAARTDASRGEDRCPEFS